MEPYVVHILDEPHDIDIFASSKLIEKLGYKLVKAMKLLQDAEEDHVERASRGRSSYIIVIGRVGHTASHASATRKPRSHRVFVQSSSVDGGSFPLRYVIHDRQSDPPTRRSHRPGVNLLPRPPQFNPRINHPAHRVYFTPLTRDSIFNTRTCIIIVASA